MNQHNITYNENMGGHIDRSVREPILIEDISDFSYKKINLANLEKKREMKIDDKLYFLYKSKSMVDIDIDKNKLVNNDKSEQLPRRKSFIESNRKNGKPRKFFDSAEYYMNKETGQICNKM